MPSMRSLSAKSPTAAAAAGTVDTVVRSGGPRNLVKVAVNHLLIGMILQGGAVLGMLDFFFREVSVKKWWVWVSWEIYHRGPKVRWCQRFVWFHVYSASFFFTKHERWRICFNSCV